MYLLSFYRILSISTDSSDKRTGEKISTPSDTYVEDAAINKSLSLLILNSPQRLSLPSTTPIWKKETQNSWI